MLRVISPKCVMPRLRQTSPAEPKTTTPAKVASLRKDIQFIVYGRVRIVYFRKMIASRRKEEGKTLAAPQGVEPRYADPESAVLPLNEGAVSANGAADGPHSDFIGLLPMGQFIVDARGVAPREKMPEHRLRSHEIRISRPVIKCGTRARKSLVDVPARQLL